MPDLAKDIDMIELLKAEGYEPKPSSGGKHAMSCPFPDHDDSQPSFFIHANNTFKCYGCGRWGDSITLVRELHNLGFKQALRYLDIRFKRIKRIIKKGDMIEEVASEERRGIDILEKYGAELINLLLTEKLKQEVKKNGK